MRSWAPHLWKECRQNLRLGLSALGAFLGIGLVPMLIGRLHVDNGRYDDDSLRIVIEFGGPILAVLAGVYAMGREQGAIERFWRSRPINLNHWLVSKYAVGVAIVGLVCWIPVLIWMILVKTVPTADVPLGNLPNMTLAYSFILLLIYSASFVLGQLVRGTFHATILAVGAMALIFLVPLVVRPLNWLSLQVLEKADAGSLHAPLYAAFVAGMVALSGALLGLGGILLKRRIQVDVTLRTLSWSIVIIVLVVAASVAFPMGTNINPQQVIAPPVFRWVSIDEMATDGNDVLVLFSPGRCGLVRIHPRGRTSVVDEPLWITESPRDPNLYYRASGLQRSTEDPSLAYVVVTPTRRRDGAYVSVPITRTRHLDDTDTSRDPPPTLCTIDLNRKQGDPVIHRVELDSLRYPSRTLRGCIHQRHLYLCGNGADWGELLTFSLADPSAPSFVHHNDLRPGIGLQAPRTLDGPPQRCQLRLIPNADLDDSTRIEITHRLAGDLWVPAADGQILAAFPNSSRDTMQLVLFETGPTQDNTISLDPVAHCSAGIILNDSGVHPSGLHYSDDLAYYFNHRTGATVYRIGKPAQIERIGHYVAGEDFSTMVAMPNHRVVLAGKRLHVLDLSGRLSH